MLRLALGRGVRTGRVDAATIDETFIQRLQQLRLVAQRASLHGLIGQHPSSRRTVAAEFADHRPYFAGDEVRRVDWNAYARTGDLLIKRSQAQEHVALVIFVDVSGSMDWGSTNKLVYARQLAAAIAYVADRTYDRVRVVSLADRVEATTAVTAGAEGLRALMRAMAEVSTEAATDLTAAVSAWFATGDAPTGTPAGLAVLISDLLPDDSESGAVRVLLEHGYEVTVLHVLDDLELNPDLQGDLELVDSETLDTLEIRAGDDAIRAYTEQITTWRERLGRQCTSLGARFVAVETSTPVEAVILNNLRAIGAVR